MAFEYKTTTEEGADVILRFKAYGLAPGRISRHNIGNMEAQVWAYLEWGLVEPANWPEGGKQPGTDVFDIIPQNEITKCYAEWQSSDDDEPEKPKVVPGS
jgi:hypothetical protein